MSNPSGSRPKHLSSSPFALPEEQTIDVFEVDDRVSHDLYGLGKVTAVDSYSVTVDFGAQSVRIKPPYAKLQHL